MTRNSLAFSAFALASAVLAGSAWAAPSWTGVGKAVLVPYGAGELYIHRSAAARSAALVAGEVRAVLDQAWEDPNDSGAYRDIYFRTLADCRDGTFALEPSWPEGPDEGSVPKRDLRRPAAGTAGALLLRAYCG